MINSFLIAHFLSIRYPNIIYNGKNTPEMNQWSLIRLLCFCTLLVELAVITSSTSYWAIRVFFVFFVIPSFKAALAVFSSFFFSSSKLTYTKNKQCKRASGVFFVWNAIISVQHFRQILSLHSYTQWTYLFACKQIYIGTRLNKQYFLDKNLS